jgi:hypothetical protein
VIQAVAYVPGLLVRETARNVLFSIRAGDDVDCLRPLLQRTDDIIEVALAVLMRQTRLISDRVCGKKPRISAR